MQIGFQYVRSIIEFEAKLVGYLYFQISELSVKLQKLEKGKNVILEYYKNHSYVKRSETITRLDHTMKWLMLGD